MIRRACVLLLLVPLLGGCQDREARAQNAELTRRVEALERQLSAAQADRPAGITADADRVVSEAAAQNCANNLTRELETFRQNSSDRIYPRPAQLALPDACIDHRVNWITRTDQAYTFSVTDTAGRELVRQSSQTGS